MGGLKRFWPLGMALISHILIFLLFLFLERVKENRFYRPLFREGAPLLVTFVPSKGTPGGSPFIPKAKAKAKAKSQGWEKVRKEVKREEREGKEEKEGMETLTLTGLEPGERDGIVQGYLVDLGKRIALSKIYPPGSLERGEAGEVMVEGVILADGLLTNLHVTHSSGFADLDKGALQTLLQVGRVGPLPEALGVDQLKIKIPIRFALVKSEP